jgi:hypothetical protein
MLVLNLICMTEQYSIFDPTIYGTEMPRRNLFANLIIFVEFYCCENANTKIKILIIQSFNLLFLKCIMTTLANTRSELYIY